LKVLQLPSRRPWMSMRCTLSPQSRWGRHNMVHCHIACNHGSSDQGLLSTCSHWHIWLKMAA
jgi:hypothetical protein